MRHSLAIIHMSLLLSVKRAMQYRWEFMLQGLLSLALALLQLVPLWLLFGERRTVAGWSFEQMLLLMGWYMMLYALVEGVIAPSLTVAVAGIRTGFFDYILLRPVDPLLLCSLADIRVWKIFDFMLGLGVASYAWTQLALPPAYGDILLAVVLAAGGLTTAYALFVLAFSASFALISVQNLTNVLTALLGFARWPIHLFELPWRFVFRFIFPVGVMTSYPIMALLGQWDGPMALGVALVFFVAARWMWARATPVPLRFKLTDKPEWRGRSLMPSRALKPISPWRIPPASFGGNNNPLTGCRAAGYCVGSSVHLGAQLTRVSVIATRPPTAAS